MTSQQSGHFRNLMCFPQKLADPPFSQASRGDVLGLLIKHGVALKFFRMDMRPDLFPDMARAFQSDGNSLFCSIPF